MILTDGIKVLGLYVSMFFSIFQYQANLGTNKLALVLPFHVSVWNLIAGTHLVSNEQIPKSL